MKRLAGSLALVLCVSLVPGCDSGTKEADAKDASAKKAEGGAKTDEAKPAEAEGDAKEEAKPAEPVKLAELSLEDTGLEAKIQAPEGAKASEEFGAFLVQAGESFQLQINTQAADLAGGVRDGDGEPIREHEEVAALLDANDHAIAVVVGDEEVRTDVDGRAFEAADGIGDDARELALPDTHAAPEGQHEHERAQKEFRPT